jgi:anti-anti-sigma regulatory factor
MPMPQFFYLTPLKLIPILSSNTRKDNIKWKECEMGIRNLSENIIVVELPSDRSERADELKTLNEIISDKCQCDVIIDFCKVEIINSWNISNLLILRGMMEQAGRKLILCNVSTVTKCIFAVAGLSEVLVFANTRSAALDVLRDTASPVHPMR